MRLVEAGDSVAFEALYERHGGATFSLAYRMVGSRVLAEDVTQEAFLAIWRSRSCYSPARGSVLTWALGITHHRAIDALRRGAVHQRQRADGNGHAEREPADELTDVEALRRQEAETVRSALDLLPGEQCRTIELAYFGGLTHAEIAERLGLPVGTVKGRIRLGLEKLRETLEVRALAS